MVILPRGRGGRDSEIPRSPGAHGQATEIAGADTLRPWKATRWARHRARPDDPAWSQTLACAGSLHGNREISHEKSHSAIVAGEPTNNILPTNSDVAGRRSQGQGPG